MRKHIDKFFPNNHPLRLFYHKFMAVMACLFYGFPASSMTIIAVTGTKGKTTTSNIIAQMLHYSGFKVGLMTSINYRIGESVWTNVSKQGTLSPFQLQKMLARMKAEGCTHVVIEVTSHAITQSRIWGTSPDIAVLTQIDEDHIEYHGSHKAYRSEKLKLFKMLRQGKRKPFSQKTAVLNQDDKYFDEFKDVACDRLITYSLNKGTCVAVDLEFFPHRTEFTLKIPNDAVRLKMNLVGEFNVKNALGAISALLSCGLSLHQIKDALANLELIPGRQESVDAGQDFSVIVDYAHTEDSLRQLLDLYKPLAKGKIILVFGCTGGGRDTAKRPKMGAVADKIADFIVLTDDDPYFEDRMKIISEIKKGVNRVEGEGLWSVPNRKEAIKLALSLAAKDDIVLLAGKGCEEVQAINGKMIPWDDRLVVRELLHRTVEVDLGSAS